jgi:hypothetical protein
LFLICEELDCSSWKVSVSQRNFFKETPSVNLYKNLIPFCTPVYYLNTSPDKKKLDKRSFPGTFIGYSKTRKSYRVLTESRSVIESTDIKLLNTGGQTHTHESDFIEEPKELDPVVEEDETMNQDYKYENVDENDTEVVPEDP